MIARLTKRILFPRLWKAEQDREYLLRWFGGFNAEFSGLSADTLTCIAFDIDPRGFNEPRDMGDLGRCERAFKLMPAHRQANVVKLLNEWQITVFKLTDERGW